jgi:propanol-preferring alcohol dehydrogenase
VLRSVANLTRDDGERFFPLAEAAGVTTRVEVLKLSDANLALQRLRRGEVRGSLVLEMT